MDLLLLPTKAAGPSRGAATRASSLELLRMLVHGTPMRRLFRDDDNASRFFFEEELVVSSPTGYQKR